MLPRAAKQTALPPGCPPLQASQSSDRAQAATVQLRALGALRDKLNSKLVEMEDERRAELAPQIKASRAGFVMCEGGWGVL